VMKASHLGVLSTVLLCGVPRVSAQGELPPAAQEVIKQFEAEIGDIYKKIEAETQKRRDHTARELKKLQDLFCRDAKLDEAVAIRDLIRSLRAGGTISTSSDLPAAAREVLKQHEEEVAEIPKKIDADIQKQRDRAVAELKRMQDLFCREAKLDEAVAVRDLIRMIRDGVSTSLPDPFYVNNGATDIGKVFYYEVVGATAGGSIYGSDVYTTGSHLAMAAVHCGALKNGQKGIVKVTILPGQNDYEAATREGITSIAYGNWGVSFKVQRVYAFVGKQAVTATP
jgi:F0F1-type ATP synthase membrane subunit b/b'